ncbi:MAG: glycosyltransferase family 2 protein [Candidatus Helarchaeota archaeon]
MVIEDLQQKTKFQEVFLTPKHASATVQLYNRSSTENQHIKISVIMPAFNEEHVVGQLIDRTHKIIRKITNDYEIIVINDGSKDRTLDICREKNVILIHNHQNWGKGYALREGFKYARGDIIITLDGDGDHHPEEIPRLINPLLEGKADVTLGTRFVNKRKTPVTSAINIFGNKFFNFLIQRLTNRHFTDTQCGFRAFKRNILTQLQFESIGYELETEMIVKIARKNIRYCEIPVNSPVTYFKKSNINRLKDGFQILLTIFKTRLKRF